MQYPSPGGTTPLVATTYKRETKVPEGRPFGRTDCLTTKRMHMLFKVRYRNEFGMTGGILGLYCARVKA